MRFCVSAAFACLGEPLVISWASIQGGALWNTRRGLAYLIQLIWIAFGFDSGDQSTELVLKYVYLIAGDDL